MQVSETAVSYIQRANSPPHDNAKSQAASKSAAAPRSPLAVRSAVFDTERSLGEPLADEVCPTSARNKNTKLRSVDLTAALSRFAAETTRCADL